jgi:hypothetical protein
MNNPWERFSGAVAYLATTPIKLLQERSLAAYSQYLGCLTTGDFDCEIRPKFERLQAMVKPILERAYAEPERLVHHDEWEIAKDTIRGTTGEKIAKLIHEIYNDICWAEREESEHVALRDD